jgi:hypothetical protein
MRRLTFAVLIIALVVGMAPGARAGTVANGSVIDIGSFSPTPPFATVGRFTIDSNGTLTLNVQTVCPNTSFDMFLACDLFAEVGEILDAFTTDASGKFVGQFPGAFDGYQGACPVPLLIAGGSFDATTCLIINGF